MDAYHLQIAEASLVSGLHAHQDFGENVEPPGSRHAIPPEILTALGDVLVSFALLEHEMKGLTSRLIGVDVGITSIVTNQLTFSDLRRAIASLWRERGELRVCEDALHALLKRAETAEVSRNNVVHSLWALNDETGNAMRIKVRVRQSKSGRDVQVEEYDAGRIHEFARELNQLTYDFQQFDPGPLWEVGLLPYPRLNRGADWVDQPKKPHAG